MKAKTEKPKFFGTKTEKPISKIAKTENSNDPLVILPHVKQLHAILIGCIGSLHM